MTEKLNQEALEPCPHCGGPADFIDGSFGKGYHVECQHCLARSGWGDYGYQVRVKWNKRVPSSLSASLAERTRERDEARDALSDAYGADPTKWPSTRLAAAEARVKALEPFKTFAHEATKSLTGLTGGGSEWFGKCVDGVYLADLPACTQRIREKFEAAHKARCAALASSDTAPESKEGTAVSAERFACWDISNRAISNLSRGAGRTEMIAVRDAIRARGEITAPESKPGWVLVPREPTEAMLRAGWLVEAGEDRVAQSRYAAMIDAAPQEPQP